MRALCLRPTSLPCPRVKPLIHGLVAAVGFTLESFTTQPRGVVQGRAASFDATVEVRQEQDAGFPVHVEDSIALCSRGVVGLSLKNGKRL